MVFAILLAAGTSQRFGRDKLREQVSGKEVWQRSFRALADHPQVDAVGIVGDVECPEAAFIVPGGATRQESSRAGIEALPDDAEVVLIHDAARPFTSAEVISRVIEGVRLDGAAYAAVPVTDTIRTRAGETLDRSELLSVQTPQGALAEHFRRAHDEAPAGATDDIALLHAIGVAAKPVEGDPANIKITHPNDLPMPSLSDVRTGFGYDTHRFSDDPDRPLMLGGIALPGPGLEGHSDADALLHAIVDALLGALGKGDIGIHFPPSDPRWKDEPSLTFLTAARDLIGDWTIAQIDATVIAERPKLAPHWPAMKAAIADALGIEEERVSLKATTNEQMGALGRAEGIAALATATLHRYNEG